MNIIWLKKAEKELNHAFDFILKEDPKSALMVFQLIKKRVEQIKNFPYLGRIGRVKNTHELIILNTPYIVIYQIKNKNIYILAVLHTSLKFPE